MRGWGSVLIALGATALAWVVAVAFSLWWIVPIAVSAIAIVIVIVTLVRSGLAHLAAARARRGLAHKEPTLADAVRAEVRAALGALEASPQGKRALEQGCFVVLGAAGSGRSTLLRELGGVPDASTSAPRGAGPPLGASPSCRWWVTPAGVFAETSAELAHQPDAWAALLDALAEPERGPLVRGVLVTCDVERLARAARQELRELGERSREQIDVLAQRLGVDPVVGVLVTKCDLLLGFVESFGALPDSSEPARSNLRDQVWGVTFRTTPHREQDAQALRDRLEAMAGALERFTLVRLAELNDLHERALVFQLPDQLRAASTAVAALFEALVPPHAERRVRGVYLTSATRSGSARSLLEEHAGALGLAWATPARGEAQSTFVRGLAEAVFAPDLAAPAPSRASLERRERGQRAGIAAVAVALVLVSGTLVWAHRWNGRLLDRAQAAASAPAPGSLDELLRVRDRLDGAPAAARLLGWRHAEVRETVASLHARTLLEGAVGEVHRDHARDLHAFASGASQDYARAYEALRAYLRLSRETSLDAMPEDERAYERRWLAGHLAHAWQRSGALAPPSARLPWYGAHALALVEWLDAGSQALPLDAAVVSRARQRARSVDRTGASMDWLCELDGRSRSVDDLLGGRRAHLRGTASVPRAFTHEGLRDEVYPWLTTTALSLDEPWVLEGTPWSAQSSHQVRERLWSAYFRRYEDEWDKLLSAVEVEVPSDREASDRMLGGVAREIALLIDGVRRETMGLDASPESWANALLAWSLTRIGDPLDGPSLPPDPVRDAAARQLQENFAPLFAFGPGETVATYESYLTGASERAELEGRRTQVVQFVQRLDVGRWRLPLERLLVSPIDAALRRF